jgi:hypothetical protein
VVDVGRRWGLAAADQALSEAAGWRLDLVGPSGGCRATVRARPGDGVGAGGRRCGRPGEDGFDFDQVRKSRAGGHRVDRNQEVLSALFDPHRN